MGRKAVTAKRGAPRSQAFAPGALDCMVVNKFYISPRADHRRAREIVEDALLASKYLFMGKPFSVLVSTALSDRGRVVVELTAKAYVYDARHEKVFASDVTDRVLTAFRDNDIEMPDAPSPDAGSTTMGSDAPLVSATP